MIDRSLLNGMCEQLYDFNISRGHSLETAYTKLREMNVQSFRAWMHFGYIFDSYDCLNKAGVTYFHRLFQGLNECGIRQIIVMSHNWFLSDPAAKKRVVMHAPARDTSDGSAYSHFLEMFETSWYLAAKEFPEIEYWETGNELNHNVFLCPAKRLQNPDFPYFTHEEKAAIMTDMMFYASRGIKRANPRAAAVMPGMAPAEALETGYIAKTLEYIYTNIESGNFGSTDSDDFFDALCWHPYCSGGMPDSEWKKYNDDIYDVARRHGDDGKKVFLSEFGFSDIGSRDTDEYLASAGLGKYIIARESMPYIESIHAFRLFDDYSAFNWGGNFEKYFGFYHDAYEGCTIKARGITLRDLYNGK
jgi:beta-glucosidase/6-phospho-beta-glucosidase/beta-galactosidase